MRTTKKKEEDIGLIGDFLLHDLVPYSYPAGSISLHTKMKVKDIGPQDLGHDTIMK